STGPKSPAGLEAAAQNAITHGMTAAKFARKDDAEIIRVRLEEWDYELHPYGPQQRWLAERVVAASVRIDRCRIEEDAHRNRQARDLLGYTHERRQGSTPLDLPAGLGGEAHVAAHQAGFVAGQIAALERHRAEVLAGLDAMDRATAGDGHGPGIGATLRLIRR